MVTFWSKLPWTQWLFLFPPSLTSVGISHKTNGVTHPRLHVRPRLNNPLSPAFQKYRLQSRPSLTPGYRPFSLPPCHSFLFCVGVSVSFGRAWTAVVVVTACPSSCFTSGGVVSAPRPGLAARTIGGSAHGTVYKVSPAKRRSQELKSV